jgi:hypothetical protein
VTCNVAALRDVTRNGKSSAKRRLLREKPMTDWQTYRNGNPREIWNLERLERWRVHADPQG